jgi:conjugal transfer pilus assembly protein TraW
MNKLRAEQASGQLDKMWEEAQARVRDKVQHPAPVPGITTCEKERVFYFDPTVVAKHDILGPHGEVLVPAGTRANPLDQQDFGDPMLFFDQQDKRQVAFAQKILKKYHGAVEPVLTGGSFFVLMHDWRRQVFYDQSGFLTKKFGIHHVPALVSQEGDLLRIEEFKM